MRRMELRETIAFLLKLAGLQQDQLGKLQNQQSAMMVLLKARDPLLYFEMTIALRNINRQTAKLDKETKLALRQTYRRWKPRKSKKS
jgi:hypothetical protein